MSETEAALLAALKKATQYVAYYEAAHESNVALDVYIECEAAIAKAEALPTPAEGDA